MEESSDSSNTEDSQCLSSESDKEELQLSRYSHMNTLEEKRRMRLNRKRRKREKINQRRKAAEAALSAQATKYKCMARSYWDRWQWELMKR